MISGPGSSHAPAVSRVPSELRRFVSRRARRVSALRRASVRKGPSHVPSSRHAAGGEDGSAAHRRPVRLPRRGQHGLRARHQLRRQRPAHRAGVSPRGPLRDQDPRRPGRVRGPHLPGRLRRAGLRRPPAADPARADRGPGPRRRRRRRPRARGPDRRDGDRRLRRPPLGRARQRLVLRRPVAAGDRQRRGRERDRGRPVGLAPGPGAEQLRRQHRADHRARGPARRQDPVAGHLASASGRPPSSRPTRAAGGRSTGPGTR